MKAPKPQASTVSFDVTRAEAAIIGRIADRAVKLADKLGAIYARMDAVMDVTAAHANGCPLDLDRLLHADDFNFGHDVFGIRRHIDRQTGEVGGFFLPRFALNGARRAAA